MSSHLDGNTSKCPDITVRSILFIVHQFWAHERPCPACAGGWVCVFEKARQPKVGEQRATVISDQDVCLDFMRDATRMSSAYPFEVTMHNRRMESVDYAGESRLESSTNAYDSSSLQGLV